MTRGNEFFAKCEQNLFDELVTCEKCQRKIKTSQCGEGFNLCSHCKLDRCACSESSCHCHPKTLEDVMDLKPAPCLFADKGCLENSVLHRHVLHCLFRPIKCQMLMVQDGKEEKCDWEGSVNQVMAHMNCFHKCNSVHFEEGKEQPVLLRYGDEWCRHFFYIEDQMFFLDSFKKNGEIYHSVRQIHLNRPTHVYSFTMAFRTDEGNIHNQYTIAAKPLDDVSLTDDYCVCTSILEVRLKELVNKEGDVTVYIKITKESVKEQCACVSKASDASNPSSLPPMITTTKFFEGEDLSLKSGSKETSITINSTPQPSSTDNYLLSVPKKGRHSSPPRK